MNQVDRIYKALATKGGVTFTEGHSVHTPRLLVEEILSKVDIHGNILVMFNIEFVVSLVYTYNINPKTITFYSDSKDKTEFAKNLGAKYITTLGTDMFDVILSNPPYDAVMEGNDQTKKIWISFIHTCLDRLNKDGSLGFVCPPSWVLSNDAKLKKVRNKILESDLQTLKLGVQNQFPSKPGVQIAYFTLIKSAYIGQTKFYDIDKDVPVIVDIRNGLPQSPKEQFRTDLVNKIHNSNNVKFKFIVNDNKAKDHSAAGVLKVIVNYSKAFYSSANTIDNNMPITTDPINNKQGYIPISTVDEGLNHKSFLHSKAIVWFANNYKRRGQTGFCDAVKRGAIPQFKNKKWTDAEVYKVLKLTKEEIAYIESNS